MSIYARRFYNIGFYGVPNVGDELLCATVSRRLRQSYPGSRLCIISRDPRITAAYANVRAETVRSFFPMPAWFRDLPRRVREIVRSDLVIVGGGGLLADSSRGHIPRYTIDLCCAVMLNRPYVFIGLGAGPIRRPWVRPLARFAFKHAAWTWCRDAFSLRHAKTLSPSASDRMEAGPDAAHIDLPQRRKLETRKPKLETPTPYALVNLRANPPLNPTDVREMCQVLLRRVGSLVMLGAEPDDPMFYEDLLASWPEQMRSACTIVMPHTLDEVFDAVRSAEVVAAERLHVNIIAAHLGARLLSIEYEPKVEQLAAMLEGEASRMCFSTPPAEGGAGESEAEEGDGEALRCSWREVGAEPARRLIQTARPIPARRLERLADDAAQCFDRAIARGLASDGAFRRRTRLHAACLVGIWWGAGVLFAAAVVLKRAFFGRRSEKRRRRQPTKAKEDSPPTPA